VADLHLRQTIELFVDQQVFIDGVHGNEKVEEFSALTEVTSFEQRGDSLYGGETFFFPLFLDNGGQGSEVATPEGGSVSPVVGHMLHRMPFDVTVPVDAQIAGMLSVTVTVPDATVDILGPGWIHIRSLVQVDGLSPVGGYTAHCGAQEAIVPATVAYPTDVPVGDTEQQEPTVDVSLEWQQGQQGQQPTEATGSLDFADLLQPLTRAVADEVGADEPPAVSIDAVQEPESSLSEGGWKSQLEDADRALFGTYSPYRTGRSDQPPDETEPSETHQYHFEAVDLGVDPSESTDQVKTLKAEFEADAVRSNWPDAVTPPIAEPELDMHWQVQDTQIQRIQEEVAQERSATAAPSELMMSYTAVPEVEKTDWTAAQWFWNTLNIPSGEHNYTMKFRIVQFAETLDDIAAKYDTSPTVLLQVNPVAAGGIEVGTLLYIPTR